MPWKLGLGLGPGQIHSLIEGRAWEQLESIYLVTFMAQGFILDQLICIQQDPQPAQCPEGDAGSTVGRGPCPGDFQQWMLPCVQGFRSRSTTSSSTASPYFLLPVCLAFSSSPVCSCHPTAPWLLGCGSEEH